MAATTKEREQFIATMVREFPDRSAGEVIAMARLFMRYSATSNRLAEELCNVEMSPREEKRHEEKDAANDRRIEALAAQWGMGVVLGGDPRGYTVKLIVPSGKTNDWGQEGLGVPQ